MTRFVDIPTLSIGTSEYTHKFMTFKLNETTEPIKFQIPRLYLPFGISRYTPPIGQDRWTMDMNLTGWDKDTYVGTFYKFIRDIENIVIDSVTEQSSHIFGSSVKRDNIVKMFNSNIKISNGYDPKFRIKYLPRSTDIFKDDGEYDVDFNLDDGVLAKCNVTCLVELSGVYFLNKMFGITWKLTQFKYYTPRADEETSTLKGFHFL